MTSRATPEPGRSKVTLHLDRTGGFYVEVEDAPVGGMLDRVYPDYGSARSYAGTLSSANAWPLVDLVARAAA
jgi:hypothetical protein